MDPFFFFTVAVIAAFFGVLGGRFDAWMTRRTIERWEDQARKEGLR